MVGRRRHDRRGGRGEQGFLSLPVLFLLLLLGGLTLAHFQESLGERISVTHHETSLRALEIAEVGLLKSELEIGGERDVDGDGIGNVSGTYGGGSYEVEAIQDVARPRRWTVIAIGSHGLSTRRLQVGLLIRRKGLFAYGLQGRSLITFQSSSSTDSFDSRLGTYASQQSSADPNGPFADPGGDVRCNGGIELQGGTGVIRGDATPGPLDIVDISPPAWVSGSTKPAEEEAVFEFIPFEEFEGAMKVNDNLSLDLSNPKLVYDHHKYSMLVKDGSTLTLPEGLYFFRELILSGGGKLRVTGPVELYVTGLLDLSGGSVLNDLGHAHDLLVFGHPYPLPPPTHKKPGLATSGGGACVMAIYAPLMKVDLHGGSEFYGAVVGDVVTLHGFSRLHYDRSLSDFGAADGLATERTYWRDLSPPRR